MGFASLPSMPHPEPPVKRLTARGCLLVLSWMTMIGCNRGPLPFEDGPGLNLDLGSSTASLSGVAEPSGIGTLADNLPFEPTGERLGSIAYRTWIYSDTGPSRTRLGYLRAGAVVDARGPGLINNGCKGGWYRTNPRGFVCLGKGATLDMEHPVLVEGRSRPRREGGFPYDYALARRPGPHRYYRLPSMSEMVAVEGREALDRGPTWFARFGATLGRDNLPWQDESPEFAHRALIKPYGVEQGLRTTVHAGQAKSESGFALLAAFPHASRPFALTTDFDLIPLDRTEVVVPSVFEGVRFESGEELRIGFHLKGAVTVWAREEVEGGLARFRPLREVREKRGFKLTGSRATGGLLETTEGTWIAKEGLRLVETRETFPSIAVGGRKWIDISIRSQVLVAYEGKSPVFATLVSTGRGGTGDPDRDQATVMGTFMIHDKSVSSTMDGDDDRADSFDLREVPFVQYFHRGFALHGAYWHDEFGRARSHGCVNLAPKDAAFLFEWTDPVVPEGWHSTINKERGTVVVIHP